MSYVPGFTHDVFISYARVTEPDWIKGFLGQLQKHLDRELRQVGASSIFWDRQDLEGDDPLTAEITQSVGNTATLVIVLSNAYLDRAWCRKELETFLNQAGADSRRAFLVLLDNVPAEEWPVEISAMDAQGFQFWQPHPHSDKKAITCPLPIRDDGLFDARIRELAKALKVRLEELKANPPLPVARDNGARRSRLSGPRVYQNPTNQPKPALRTAVSAKNIVLMAESRPDVKHYAVDFARFLRESGHEVIVLDAFSTDRDVRADVSVSLLECDLFVQVLGAEPFPLNRFIAPDRYEHWQWQEAKNVQKSTLRWRPPLIDINEITDAEYKQILNHDVVRCDPEEFKSILKDRLRALSVTVSLNEQSCPTSRQTSETMSGGKLFAPHISVFEHAKTLFRCPYPGLRPYDTHDAALFFGRETQVADMISILEQRRFLAVVGASGSGKSSLVRAGLLPAIEKGHLSPDGSANDNVWHFFTMRPGNDPYHALASSLVHQFQSEMTSARISSSQVTRTTSILQSSQFGLKHALRDLRVPESGQFLVLVDQFEELFRFGRHGDDASLSEERNRANAFVNLLLKSAEQTERSVFVILTMRSDFLGDCDAFLGLPEAISRSQYLTPRLTRSQLHDAICGPLHLFEGTIEDALVTRILNDVGTARDQLPMMQHALMRTWERAMEVKDKADLFTDDYESIGGVNGALNLHADEIFYSLGDDSTRQRLQRVAERLFCSLSERREGKPLTRRPITVAQAAMEAGATASDLESVVLAFQAANLLFAPYRQLSSDMWLNISHESLLRQWNRLEAWFDAETKSAMSYRRLIDAVRFGQSYLTDFHLIQAEEWLKWAQPNVHWAMRYDDAWSLEAGLFPRCVELIFQSRMACEQRLQMERAEAADAVRRREAELAAMHNHVIQYRPDETACLEDVGIELGPINDAQPDRVAANHDSTPSPSAAAGCGEFDVRGTRAVVE